SHGFCLYWFIDHRHTPRREPREFVLSAASGIDARAAKLRRRKVDRILKPISAGFTGPEVPNTTLRHVLRPFRCDHVGTTLGTLHDDTLFARRPFARPQPPLIRTSGRLAV